jgi:hypothetical protein
MNVISLKPQDVIVAIGLGILPGKKRSLVELGRALGLSTSEAHAGIGRGAAAGLLDAADRRIRVRNVIEFLEHGIRYTFVSNRGPVTRGVPTAHSATPLINELAGGPGLLGKMYGRHGERAAEVDDSVPRGLLESVYADLPVVWPHPEGTIRGESLEPLYPTAVDAALRDPALYECLALVDALRIGRARERDLAGQLLRQRLRGAP